MTKRLRVELRRTGGFAGLDLHVTLDSDQLSRADAERLEALTQEADLDALAAAPTPGSTAPDAMRYVLVIERDGRRWEAVLTEPHVPATARPLLQYLTAARQADAS